MFSSRPQQGPCAKGHDFLYFSEGKQIVFTDEQGRPMCLRCGFIPSANTEEMRAEVVARWLSRELYGAELRWEDHLPKALELLRELRGGQP
jgi:hypothetical protein